MPPETDFFGAGASFCLIPMNVTRILIAALIALALASAALAHGGHKHQFLGTVKAVEGSELLVTTTEGEQVTFKLTEKTRYRKGTAAATKADLRAGVRVSVYVENDGKTATTIKIAG